MKKEGNEDVNLKLLYLNNLSRPIVKYEQIKNMDLEKRIKTIDKTCTSGSGGGGDKTVFTDDDFKNFAKSYFNK
jgi:hypothetical protein